MATILTGEYQRVATITSPNYSSCKSYLYLKYSGNTVYYKITFIGQQNMNYNSLSSYLRYADEVTLFKDLTTSCKGGSTSSTEWEWQNGSWTVDNSNKDYTQELVYEGYGAPAPDSRQKVHFTYTVPSQTVITAPNSPIIDSVKWDTSTLTPTSKVTVNWSCEVTSAKPVGYFYVDIFLNEYNASNPLASIWQYAASRSYTFNLSNYNNINYGDKILFIVYASNDVGTSNSSVSEKFTITKADANFIQISIDGNTFATVPAYISINGSEFIKINKDIFKVIN